MRNWTIGIGALVAIAGGGPVIAAQCATVTFSPGNVSLPSWNPINGSSAQATFTATIRRESRSTRNVRIIFTDSDDSSAPVRLGVVSTTSGPRYEVIGPGSVNVVFPKNTTASSQSNPLIPIDNGPSGDVISVNYTVNVPANSANTDFRNGSYAESLSYQVQCFQASSFKDQGTDGPVTGPALSLTIPNLVSLTTASPATLDFQNFTTLTQQLNVGVKSTGPINVDLRTDNHLKMIRAGAPSPAPDNSYISYGIELNGQAISSDPYILSNAPRAGVAGSQWPLKLTLPSTPSGKVAGNYSDTITLTLTPGT
jgi:hypothetical protein